MRHTSIRIADMQRWRGVHLPAGVSFCRRDIEAEFADRRLRSVAGSARPEALVQYEPVAGPLHGLSIDHRTKPGLGHGRTRSSELTVSTAVAMARAIDSLLDELG